MIVCHNLPLKGWHFHNPRQKLRTTPRYAHTHTLRERQEAWYIRTSHSSPDLCMLRTTEADTSPTWELCDLRRPRGVPQSAFAAVAALAAAASFARCSTHILSVPCNLSSHVMLPKLQSNFWWWKSWNDGWWS